MIMTAFFEGRVVGCWDSRDSLGCEHYAYSIMLSSSKLDLHMLLCRFKILIVLNTMGQFRA